jgi:hypothetical protein
MIQQASWGATALCTCEKGMRMTREVVLSMQCAGSKVSQGYCVCSDGLLIL